VLLLPTPQITGATSGSICVNYGHTGHFTRECTASKKNTTEDHINYLQCGQQKVAVAKTDHIKYTTIEDVPKGEQVPSGTVFLNGYPIAILFDSGATHNFISKTCTKNY
jgi:hypothetical protein